MKLSELKPEEYKPYYKTYLDHLSEKELITMLRDLKEEFSQFLKTLTPADMSKSYAEGKWTVAEVLQHMIDTERIFQTRALRIARNDKTPLPGYDHDSYVSFSEANERDFSGLIYEFETVRNSGISLFQSFDAKMLRRIGEASGGPLSPAAAGFIMAGHQKHHHILFKTKYGL